jgi:hypothetical protein
MTPVLWVALFLGAGAASELISPILAPNRVHRFPLNLMRSKDGPRTVLLIRIVGSAAIFGAILGVLGGFTVLAARALLKIIS